MLLGSSFRWAAEQLVLLRVIVLLSEACNHGWVTDPTPPPAWQAAQIGPGALDPLLIRPVGNVPIGGGRPGSPMGYPMPIGSDRSEWIQRAPVPGHVFAYQSGQLGHRSSAISMTDHSGPLAPRSYRDSQQKFVPMASNARQQALRDARHRGDHLGHSDRGHLGDRCCAQR